MKYIDMEKVIKGVHDARRYFEDREWVDKSVGVHIDVLNDAITLLKEQEAERLEFIETMARLTAENVTLKEQEWIPVTERLPEVRHAVLCYSPHHKNIWALSLHEDNEWYYWIPMYEKYNPDFEGDITHWMPLPEHPKEGW